MRRLLLVLALLALVVPTAAAKRPPHPGKSATNVAHLCKDLHAASPALFKQTFGLNKNHRNAYGKCVSALARAKHHPGSFTLHNLTLTSSGTVTGAGAPGCQFSPAGCTVTTAGTIGGAFSGSYSSSLTILWTQHTPNGAGGFCAPASGRTTLALPGLGTLTKSEQGTVCEVGATGPNVEHTMTNGSFTISAGTGIFSGASGSGSSSFDQKPGPVSALGGAVADSETFTTLTITP